MNLDLLTPPAFWFPDRLCEPDSWVGHIPFAFWLMDAIKPRTFVELGTHTGNSYFAFCQAVKRLEIPTTCFAVDTWQGDCHAGFYGQDIFDAVSDYHDLHYASFSRLVRSTFDEAVNYFEPESLDLLHIDGLHSYEAVKHDFETWLPKLSNRGIMLFHDINVREKGFGVWEFWGQLSLKYPHFSFIHSHGLGLLYIGSEPPVSKISQLVSLAPEHRVLIRDTFARLGNAMNDKLLVNRQNLRLDQLLSEKEQLIEEHDQLGGDFEQCKERVVAMESSKFWQLRKSWFKFKMQLGLKGNE
jgi:hypothetical protein